MLALMLAQRGQNNLPCADEQSELIDPNHYAMAAYTGLRATELASIEVRSLDLESEFPLAAVAAAHSKRKRAEHQPLRPDLAAILNQWLKTRDDAKSDDRLWPGSWADKAAEMLRGDLEAAGIPYRDDMGRYFDFHALRHQFISNLALAGVHPKVAQVLARHSSISLTMDRYTHVPDAQVAEALDRLPELPAVDHKCRCVDEAETDSPSKMVAPMVAPPVDFSCPGSGWQQSTGKQRNAGNEKPLARKGFDASCQPMSQADSKRGRRDLNPQPPDRQSGTLTN